MFEKLCTNACVKDNTTHTFSLIVTYLLFKSKHNINASNILHDEFSVLFFNLLSVEPYVTGTINPSIDFEPGMKINTYIRLEQEH